MCDVFECNSDDKEGTVEVLHSGRTIATFCQDCTKMVQGIQVVLKKQPDGKFELQHVDLLDRVL
jgi:hypothetical protein